LLPDKTKVAPTSESRKPENDDLSTARPVYGG
jgi:hypothetical protein